MSTIFDKAVEALRQLQSGQWKFVDHQDVVTELAVAPLVDVLRANNQARNNLEWQIKTQKLTPMQKTIPSPDGMNDEMVYGLLPMALAGMTRPSDKNTRELSITAEDDTIRLVALKPEAVDAEIPAAIRRINLFADEAKKGWKAVKSETGKDEYEHALDSNIYGQDWMLFTILNASLPAGQVRRTNIQANGKEIPCEESAGLVIDSDQKELMAKRVFGTDEESAQAAREQDRINKDDRAFEEEIKAGTRPVFRIAKTPETKKLLQELLGFDPERPKTQG